MEHCNAITMKKKECTNIALSGTKYCSTHLHYNNFSDSELRMINDGIAHVCKTCNHWSFDGMTHDICKDYKKDRYVKKKSNKIICKWFNGKGGNCKREANGDYCEMHSYVNEYTEEQKNVSRECKKCHKFKYTGEKSVCASCR